jgi:hypothetical protein
VLDFSAMRAKKTASANAPTTASATAATPSASAPAVSSTATPATSESAPKVQTSKLLQFAKARLEGKNIKSTDEIADPTDKVETESTKVKAETTTPETAPANVNVVSDNASDVKVEADVITPSDSVTEAKLETRTEIAKKSSLQEQLAKAVEAPVPNDISPPTKETIHTATNEFRVYTKDFLWRYVDRICAKYCILPTLLHVI